MKTNFEQRWRDLNQLTVDKALDFFCDKLDISESQRSDITIGVSKKLKSNGRCSGHYYMPTNTILSLRIELRKDLSTMEVVETLAHELIHAKQHFNGEFHFKKVYKPFLFLFKISEWKSYHKNQCLDETPYFDQDCEQEAFTRSRQLFFDFINHITNKQIRLSQDNEQITEEQLCLLL